MPMRDRWVWHGLAVRRMGHQWRHDCNMAQLPWMSKNDRQTFLGQINKIMNTPIYNRPKTQQEEEAAYEARRAQLRAVLEQGAL